jgi:Mce-associated membrane protein
MTRIRISTPARIRAGTAVLLTVLASALAFGGVQVSRLHRESIARHERTQVVQAARAEVLALTDISATTTNKEINALLAGMTKHLRSQFEPQAEAFRQAMVQNKVASHGRVVAIGLTTSGPRRASAVVAAAARVANSRTAGDQERSYRLKLGLLKVGSRWLVDSMEFVS